MYITRLGSKQFLIKDKIKQPRVNIILGQPDQKKKTPPEADIILVGLGESVSGIDQAKSCLINLPGEYDIKDVFIRGIQDNSHIVYLLDLDGQKIVYLSGLAKAELDDRRIEQLGDVHLLIISVDGDGLGPQAAVKLVNRIEPRMVIPMDYKADELNQFLKTLGAEKQAEESSLQLQLDSLPEEGLIIKVLGLS
jgi:hypothetical protein